MINLQPRKATLDIPEVINLQSDQWDTILKSWAYINLKTYELTLKKGQIINKRVLYFNPKEEQINLKVISNMSNIIEVKTQNIQLQGNQKDYIKFIIKTPQTACKLHVKIALLDASNDQPHEGMEFDLIISNLLN